MPESPSVEPFVRLRRETFAPRSNGAGSDSSTSETDSAKAPPERLPLFPPLPPAAPYPLDALGPVLADAAHAIAHKVQAPDAIAAQSVLAAASLAAQAHADVTMPYGQRRPIGLYLVTIAASGDRKSTADNEALWPIRRREEVMQEIHAQEYQDFVVTHAAWSAEKKRIEGERKLGYEDRKAALITLGPEPLAPIKPVLTSAEPTFEGLVRNWPNLPPALGIFTAEGGQFTGGHGMAQESRLRTAAGFSICWDGGAITRIRSLDGVSSLRGRRLAMHLMVQPDAATCFLADPVLRDQGLLSRILVAAPDSIAGTRLYRSASPEDDARIRRYHARLLTLLEGWPVQPDRTQGLLPRELPMCKAAQERWCDLYNFVEERCGTGGDLRPIRDFAAKAAEHAARIAGVLTVVADERAAEIGAETMTSSVRLTTWYVEEALRLQQASHTDPALLRAQALLEWLGGRDETDIRFSDVLRLGPAATRTKKEADAAVGLLVEHNLATQVSDRPRLIRLTADAEQA